MRARITLLGMLSVCVLAAAPVHAQFTNGQAAVAAWGQTSLTANTSGTSATTLFIPQFVAYHQPSGKVFVSDTQNHRVLRFASVSALVSGTAAEAVFGQPNFTANTPTTAFAPTASGMRNPYGLAVSAAGSLYVADAGNNRVLRFDGATVIPSGTAASAVLGQSTFTTGASATSQTGLAFPYGLLLSSSGRLYVADILNNRVVAFDNAIGKPNGGTADLVLGQASFTSNAAATTASGMNRPYHTALSPGGDLYVAEQGNNRVTRFPSAGTLASGASATGVLGQPNLTSNAAAVSATGFDQPSSVAFDGSGQLYVADYNNNRVLIFNAATTSAAAGGAASIVLGQATFTTNASATTATGMSFPKHALPLLYLAPAFLFVADSFNNRVLAYTGTYVATDEAPTPSNSLRATVSGDAVRLASRRAQTVRAEAFTVLGQRVATLFDGAMADGAVQDVRLPAGTAAGLYLVRVFGAENVQTVRLVRR